MSDVDHKDAHEWREESSVDPNVVALASSYVPGSPEEKALVRKIDLHIVVSISGRASSRH
jgi:hypothetical protein